MVGWHHRLNGHGFGDGQGSLACCTSWGRKESDTTEQPNWTETSDQVSAQLLILNLTSYKSRCLPKAQFLACKIVVIIFTSSSSCEKSMLYYRGNPL